MDRLELEQVTARILEALADLRPFLEADGGDISLEEVTPDGIARVRLHGACTNCAMSPMTMKAGVEEAIKLTTTCFHPLCHLCLCKTLNLHFLFNLPCKDAFYCKSCYFFMDAVFNKKNFK